MKEKLSKTLSEGRLAELFQLTKLRTLSDNEKAMDQSYLDKMVNAAAEIDDISVDHLSPATHAFDAYQRLRQDEVFDTKENCKYYQKLSPVMVKGLYSVPTIME